jgi:quinolinate synthase
MMLARQGAPMDGAIKQLDHDAVRRLAYARDAAILAHSFQSPEIQDVADLVGDTLSLAERAQHLSNRTFAVCGAPFVAETVKVLNPTHTVLAVDGGVGCPLADGISAKRLHEWREHHRDAAIVCTANTSLSTKAASDYCVSATNAPAVLKSISPQRPILFLPDMFFGWWLKQSLGLENMHVWSEICPVHAAIRPAEMLRQHRALPGSELLIHPECDFVDFAWDDDGRLVLHDHVQVLSGDQMVCFAQASDAEVFIVAAEPGIVHRLRKEAPEKVIVAVDESAVCPSMERVTLGLLCDALHDRRPQLELEYSSAIAARWAIERARALATRSESDFDAVR